MRALCSNHRPITFSESTKRLVTALIILSVMMLLLSCGKAKPVRIGFVGGLTGRNYDLGISGRNGINLAVEEVNAAGGVNGRRIELLTRDDMQQKDAALKAVTDLISQDVVAIIGHMTSSMSEVTLPVANTQAITMISPTSSSSFFAEKDDNFIMLHPSTRASASFFSGYLINRTGLRRVAVIYDAGNRSYTESWYEGFKESFEARGGSVLSHHTYTAGPDVRHIEMARLALKDRPDGVLIIASALDAAMLCQQIRKSDKNVRILSSEWAFTGDILKHGGPAVEGALFVQKINLDSSEPAYLEFKRKYADRFGRQPDFAALLAYDALNVICSALKAGATKETMKQTIIATGKFQGLLGEFSIDKNGDARRRHYIITVKDNAFTVLE